MFKTLKKWIKNLRCEHELKSLGVKIIAPATKAEVWECTKCGKRYYD